MKYTLDQAAEMLMDGKTMKNGTVEYTLDGTQKNMLRTAISKRQTSRAPVARGMYQAIDRRREQWMAEWEEVVTEAPVEKAPEPVEISEEPKAPEVKKDPPIKSHKKSHGKKTKGHGKGDMEASHGPAGEEIRQYGADVPQDDAP